MECRDACGACCVAPSIKRPFYGMPNGKPAGVACIHLSAQLRCQIFNDPRRPPVCEAFAPESSFCGDSREHALHLLAVLEIASTPSDTAS